MSVGSAARVTSAASSSKGTHDRIMARTPFGHKKGRVEDPSYCTLRIECLGLETSGLILRRVCAASRRGEDRHRGIAEELLGVVQVLVEAAAVRARPLLRLQQRVAPARAAAGVALR